MKCDVDSRGPVRYETGTMIRSGSGSESGSGGGRELVLGDDGIT